MLLNHLFIPSMLWLSAQAIRRISVIPGNAVFCGNLPKQSTDDLEEIAFKFRNSWCEILDPPFDDKDRVRLRWLGDERTSGAVRRRYLKSVPVVYAHYIEDNDESTNDTALAQEYISELKGKLKRDESQIVTTSWLSIYNKATKCHVLSESYSNYLKAYQDCASRSPSYGQDLVRRVLDRKIIPIPHRIHETMTLVRPHRYHMEEIAKQASPEQSWSLSQRPALRIHLFPNEQSFIRYGGELYDEIQVNPKSIAFLAAPDAPDLTRWWLQWDICPFRISPSLAQSARLFVTQWSTWSDPQVLRDKHKLTSKLYVLFSQPHSSPQVHQIMKKLPQMPGYRTKFNQKMARIKKLRELMREEKTRLEVKVRSEDGREFIVEQKAKAVDDYLKKWHGIVMAELVLRKGDNDGFWSLFAATAKEIGPEMTPMDIEREVVRDIIVLWKSVDRWLDPSYTMNLIVCKGPDVEQCKLKEEAQKLNYSWRALKGSLQWIDYDGVQEDATV